MIGDRNARSKATEIVALRGEEPVSYVPNSFNRILNSKYRIEDRHRVAAAVDTLVYFTPPRAIAFTKTLGLLPDCRNWQGMRYRTRCLTAPDGF